MNQYQHIKEAEKYIRTHHSEDSTGHDIQHVMRVVKMGLFIAEQEGSGNPYIIQMAALLHDTVDSKLTNEDEAYEKLENFLDQIDVDNQMKHKILEIIKYMSYRNGANNDRAMSQEGYIVRDADRLDAIGAIGIARTFQFAGHFNEPMWSGEIPDSISSDCDLNDYSPSAIKHFYDKLFKLKNLMHTETAQTIAQERHQFMEYFVAQFFKEWDFMN